MLNYLCTEQFLHCIPIDHCTYHHFQGNGDSDSHLDKLLYSSDSTLPEKVLKIICKLDNPLIESHHDIIISSFGLPYVDQPIITDKMSRHLGWKI